MKLLVSFQGWVYLMGQFSELEVTIYLPVKYNGIYHWKVYFLEINQTFSKILGKSKILWNKDLLIFTFMWTWVCPIYKYLLLFTFRSTEQIMALAWWMYPYNRQQQKSLRTILKVDKECTLNVARSSHLILCCNNIWFFRNFKGWCEQLSITVKLS